MAGVLSKMPRGRLDHPKAGWERLALATSFVTTIACPIVGSMRAVTLCHLDQMRTSHYSTMRVQIIQVCCKILHRGKRRAYWRLLEADVSAYFSLRGFAESKMRV